MKLLFANKILELEILNKINKKKNFCIFAANPKIQAYLRENNINFYNTLDFFNRNDHFNSIKLTNKICKTVLKSQSIRFDYLFNNLFFYFRFYISTIIYLILVIKNIKKKFYNKIYILKYNKLYKYNFDVHDLLIEFEKDRIKKNWIKKIIFSIISYVQYLYINLFLKNKNKIIINSNDYNLGLKISNIFKNYKDYVVISLNSSLKDFFFLKKINTNYYSFFLRDTLIFKRKKKISLSFIKTLNNQFSKIIYQKFNKKLSRELQEYFCLKISNKINNFLDKDAYINYYLANLKKIKIALSQHSLDTASSLSFYSKINKIKSFCCSHGTYSFTKNFLANSEWNAHSKTMISINNDYIISHSKIMTDFLKKNNKNYTKTKIIKLKPLLFSTNQKQNNLNNLEIQRLFRKLKINPKKKIILHASSPKLGRSVIYETIDEYIENIRKIISVVDSNNLFLLISFRPYKNLDLSTFTKLLPISKNYLVLNNISINKLIQLSEVIISYSSTIIEEALFLNKPVILYDPSNIYNHYDNNYMKKFKFFKKNLYVNNKSQLSKKIKKVLTLKKNLIFKSKLFYLNEFSKKIL